MGARVCVSRHADLEAEAREQFEELSKATDRVELLTLLSRPDDGRNCFFNIQAGTGGADAQDWASMLMRLYLRYFERNGFEMKFELEEKGASTRHKWYCRIE